MPFQDRFDGVNPARLVTVRPCVTVDEPRRERFQCWHLPLCGRRAVLEQVSLAILCPSLRRRFREAGRGTITVIGIWDPTPIFPGTLAPRAEVQRLEAISESDNGLDTLGAFWKGQHFADFFREKRLR